MIIYAIILMIHDWNLLQTLNPLETNISSCGNCLKAVSYQYPSQKISEFFKA